MKRAEIMATARTQASDARCINNKRGMGKRAKRQGAKQVRQHLMKEDGKHSLETDRPGPDSAANVAP